VIKAENNQRNRGLKWQCNTNCHSFSFIILRNDSIAYFIKTCVQNLEKINLTFAVKAGSILAWGVSFYLLYLLSLNALDLNVSLNLL